MSTYPNSQFIVIKSDGTVINYYYHNDFGICSSVLSPSGKWNNAVSGAEDAKKDYSVAMDPKDTVYIVYRNRGGFLKLILHNESVSKTVDILQSKNRPDYNMFPRIIPEEDYSHVFYIVENGDKKIICHQVLKSGKPLAPSALDYIQYDPLSAPYSIADTDNRIFLLYCSKNEDQPVPGYKTYEKSTGKWSKFIPLVKHGDSIHAPFISSYENRVLITYVKNYEDASYIIARSVSREDGSLQPEHETVRCVDSFINPVLLMTEKENIIHWREGRQVKYISFFDNAGNAALKTLEFTDRNHPLSFNVTVHSDQKIIQGWLLPGNFTDGLTLGFLKTPLYTDSSKAVPTNRQTQGKPAGSFLAMSDEYKAFELLQGKIADLERKIRNLNDRISILEKDR